MIRSAPVHEVNSSDLLVEPTGGNTKLIVNPRPVRTSHLKVRVGLERLIERRECHTIRP